MLSRFFNGFSDIDFGVLLLSIPSVMIALMVHEVSHGYVAHLCGDDTAKNHGRLSFNIFRHLDPVGTLLLLFFGYGYARPVPVNYRNLRKPRRDIALVSLAGPGSNLIMAFLAVVLYYIILIVFTVTSGVSTENTGIFNGLSRGYRKSWMHAIKFNFIMGPSVDMISAITTAFVYVLGIRWILAPDATLTVGVLIAFTAYIGRFWAPINTLAAFYNSLLTAISYLERIFETIDEPVRVKDAPGAKELPPIHGDVEFKDVSFSYEEGSKILDSINFKVKQGQTYAIVGPTGAGKSTIVNLISRFYNVDSGQILIDGHDISKYTIRSLRTQMGVMMQDSFIFAGTIMDNIRYGNMNATDEEVIEAAKTVCAHDFISSMENGYYTEVNERGSRLSAGQRQLISFARALLANPKILILDEATSSIDTETELLLQKGLARLLEGRTSFIIAHRLSTIKNADCIMYVADGAILEKGTHEELLAQKGAYYDLYMSQFDFLMQDAKKEKEESA